MPRRSPSARVTSSPTFRAAAQAFLLDSDRRCAHCRAEVHIGAPNTDPLQATVDHAVEVARDMVDPMDTRYWLVACRSCNSRRGARYQQGGHHASEAW